LIPEKFEIVKSMKIGSDRRQMDEVRFRKRMTLCFSEPMAEDGRDVGCSASITSTSRILHLNQKQAAHQPAV
jgi:hypothetical protein